MATVALLLATPGLDERLRDACAPAGLRVSAVHLQDLEASGLDADAVLRALDPTVVVYDLAPPYPAALARLRTVLHLPAVLGREIVVTAIDPAVDVTSLEHYGRLIDVVGQHEDFVPLVLAIKEATRARPSR